MSAISPKRAYVLNEERRKSLPDISSGGLSPQEQMDKTIEIQPSNPYLLRQEAAIH